MTAPSDTTLIFVPLRDQRATPDQMRLLQQRLEEAAGDLVAGRFIVLPPGADEVNSSG